ncbi:MAG: hypothetical protein ACKPKO_13005, partial [Candidatus Fonsibacter sp.]
WPIATASGTTIWAASPGAGGLNESQEMLGVALLWRGAEVWAMHCLAYILDVVDNCSVLVP